MKNLVKLSVFAMFVAVMTVACNNAPKTEESSSTTSTSTSATQASTPDSTHNATAATPDTTKK